VTEADLAVDAFLMARLRPLFPQAAWLSEETLDADERFARASVLVVDPIDGTRGFAAGDKRWAVSIALVREGRPIAGALAAPALDERIIAAAGCGAHRNGVPLRLSNEGRLAGGRLAGPQPLSARVAESLSMTLIPKIPSLALRFAHVGAGDIDAALSAAHSHDWDIAAADLILHEAGGKLTGLDGRAPVYNRRDLEHGALAAASAATHADLVAAIVRAQRVETSDTRRSTRR
jgi:myo-inositol-1(or 4)-monophosphatase